MIQRGKRDMTTEEKRLWEEVTRHDAPLQESRIRVLSPIKVATPAKAGVLKHLQDPCLRRDDKDNGEQRQLQCGAYANIDRNTAQRFHRGEYPIDATLDLHGLSREKAHYALSDFIGAHYERGSRCLLVITGKGKPGSCGVLRESLPLWLSAPGLKSAVLAFDVARAKHGGAGAYYILLRRKRAHA